MNMKKEITWSFNSLLMKKKTTLFVFFLFVSFSLFAQSKFVASFTIPDGLGYNIHFTDPQPGEMAMIKASGATTIRMDITWSATEPEKGVYDFSSYERLTDSLEKYNLKPLYILCYSNKHYDEGLSPYSEEGRTAFAQWAAAAVTHFKGRGILWEIYNEPNLDMFWTPKTNPEKFILLALETGRAIRAAALEEIYIGPATSSIDLKFLEQCFKAGLLEYWNAVSVHPYRRAVPESVFTEYAGLRRMIDQYAPAGKEIPILAGEWGYSSAWENYDDDLQGKTLPRQWMINLAAGVPVSIWYDWHDDGTDTKEPEHHFGMTNYAYKSGQVPVYDPKPAYLAAKTFMETFHGFRFNKRIRVEDPDVYVFLFEKGKKVKLAVWTSSKTPRTIIIPCVPGSFELVSHLGEKLPDLASTTKELSIPVSDAPVYLIPKNNSAFWTKPARGESMPVASHAREKSSQHTDPNPTALLGNRFLTFSATIRANYHEFDAVRPQDYDSNKEYDLRNMHTPDRVRAYRAAVEKGFPGARITWAISQASLDEPSEDYCEIRRLIVEYHRRYGDEVTFWLGYFPNALNPTTVVNKQIHDGLATVSALVGNGYRPRSIISGFLSSENLRYLAEVENVHVCQGNIFSQFSIDGQDGDGSVCYPYYPSKEHFCKPAQNAADFIDCVNLDGWTVDFLAGRRNGYANDDANPLVKTRKGSYFCNSRLGVGPIETIYTYDFENALREMLHTTALHFDAGFALNGFAWVTNIWEMDLDWNMNSGDKPALEGMSEWFAAIKKRWTNTRFITIGEFGLLWRQHYKDNSFNYVFDEPAGTGIGGSDYNKSLRWFMNKNFRFALLGDANEHPLANPAEKDNEKNTFEVAAAVAAAKRPISPNELVIDFTRYTLPAKEPTEPTRRWSLLGDINQKQTREQDKPVPFEKLPQDLQKEIVKTTLIPLK